MTSTRRSNPIRLRGLTPILLLGLGSLLLIPTTVAANSGCYGSNDSKIYLLIDSLRTAGNAISIDGNDSDWAAFPSFPDEANDLPGNPGQDIVAGSIAPLSDRIKFFARTAGAPNQTDGAFALSIEALAEVTLDAQIILNPVSGVHVVILFDLQNQPIFPPAGVITDPSLEIAFGSDFIEVDVPYALLTPFLPDLALPAQRSWVRGGVGSLSGSTVLDFGPGTTSYRLITTPYDLDPPLKSTVTDTPLDVRLPFQGQWFVSQDAFSAFSHASYWAYDFSHVDTSFNRASPPDSTNNADYYAFGEPVLAPISGTVTDADGSNPDVPPLNPMNAPYNVVEIDAGGGLFVSMLHEKQNSISVNVNDVVSAGQQVGEVGNSGYSTSAHLHLEVNEAGAPLGASVRGARLERVRVSLNPATDDPWARSCPVWDIREGFMVESLPAPVPGMNPIGFLMLLGALFGAAGFMVHLRNREGIQNQRDA